MLNGSQTDFQTSTLIPNCVIYLISARSFIVLAPPNGVFKIIVLEQFETVSSYKTYLTVFYKFSILKILS